MFYPSAAAFGAETAADSGENLGNRRRPTATFFRLGAVGTVGKYPVDGGDGHGETALAAEHGACPVSSDN